MEGTAPAATCATLPEAATARWPSGIRGPRPASPTPPACCSPWPAAECETCERPRHDRRKAPSMSDPLYFDYNASTPVDPEVLEAALAWMRQGYANPGAAHPEGRRAAAAIA